MSGEFTGTFDEFKKKHKEVAVWMPEEEREAWLKEQYNKLHIQEKEKKLKTGRG